MPNRWTTRFETWVVPKPNHPPTRLDSNAKPLDHSIWDLGSPQAKSPPLTCLDSNAKSLNHSIWDLNKFQIPNYTPRRVWIQDSKPLNHPVRDFEQISNPKLPPLMCLDSGFQTVELLQIEILNKFQIPISPNCLEEFPNQVRFVYILRLIWVPNPTKVSPKFV